MTVQHAFGGGMYIKQCVLRPGYTYEQHRHTFDHLSILASGEADIEVEGVTTRHTAPAIITIKAQTTHSVTPLTDVLWYCCHATDKLDEAEIDEELIHAEA